MSDDDVLHPDGFPGSDDESHYAAPALMREIRSLSEPEKHTERLNQSLSAFGTHALKTWPEFFEAVLYGGKSFEIRKNDRDYKVGDLLILREWDPKDQKYTGRRVEATVTYITDGGSLGCLTPGYICMGIKVDR